MKKILGILLFSIAIATFSSCEDSDDSLGEPKLIIKFKFNPNQVRLNNIGQPSSLTVGHGAQSPVFNGISAHYIELAPNANTQLGDGTIIYHAPQTTIGGSDAIDFAQSKIVGEDEIFFEIPLRLVKPDSYKWIRVSLGYQNYQISVRSAGQDYSGTLASFVGFNTYINSFNIGNNIFDINANKPQGFWAFALNDQPYSSFGQAPAGATTVPNPLSLASPIPPGSCVVTGDFFESLVISDNEKRDITVTLSLSVNKSFEWQEVVNDGKFEPSQGENVVDMGLRGLIPSYTR